MMHCEWCGRETKGFSVYGRVICGGCLDNPRIIEAQKADYERRRARGW